MPPRFLTHRRPVASPGGFATGLGDSRRQDLEAGLLRELVEATNRGGRGKRKEGKRGEQSRFLLKFYLGFFEERGEGRFDGDVFSR